jgi:hypothetical protein
MMRGPPIYQWKHDHEQRAPAFVLTHHSGATRARTQPSVPKAARSVRGEGVESDALFAAPLCINLLGVRDSALPD